MKLIRPMFDVLMLFISSFGITAGNVPAEFDLDSSIPVIPPSGSVDVEPQASTLDSIFSALFMSVLKGTVCFRQKTLLNSALCALLGTSDHKILTTSLKEVKGTRAICKVSHPVKAAVVLEKASARCVECLRRIDPKLLSFAVPVLISFIARGKPFGFDVWHLASSFLSSHVCAVEQDESQRKVSADLKLFYGIFVPVAHQLLKIRLDAMECISFLSDLDSSVSLSTEYLNLLARILLPFFQTDEGMIAARVLLESKPESNTCPAHVEAFFSGLMLQLSSLPQHISGSFSPADVTADSECVFVDIFGCRVASLVFSSKLASSFEQRFGGHRANSYTISVEVQVGSEKPITHIIHSSIAALPSSLRVSLSFEQRGVFVFVDSVPICIISVSNCMLNFSKLVCSVPLSFSVQHDKISSGTAPLPHWLRLFLGSKLQQQALDSSPISGSSVRTILKYTERVSLLLDKMSPSNRSVGWSSLLQHTLLAELVNKHLFR